MKDDNIIYLNIQQILHYFNISQELHNLAILHKLNNEVIEHISFKADHFSIIIVKSGQLRMTVNNAIHHLKKNDVLILPPGKNIKIEDIQNSEIYAVLFTEKYIIHSVFFQNHFKLYPFFNHELQPSFKLKNNQVCYMISILKLINIKISENSKKIEDYNIAELLFQTFIMQLMLYFNINTQYSSINKNDLVYRFFNLVSLHFKSNREVQFYADQLVVNPKYLSRLLNKKTGKSAKEYIDEAVIMEARRILDNPKKSIKSAADELNFSDQFHFSQYFKRVAGRTPTEYRTESDF